MTTEALQAEIERFTNQLVTLEEESKMIEDKIRRTKQERELWQSILSIRQPGSIIPTITPVHAARLGGDNEEYGAKSKVMKQHIMNSIIEGVTPKSVQEYMIKQDLPVSANFVYKTLNKMKADGEIVSTGGVWRPVQRTAPSP